jgi:hypothetical protein
MSWQELVAALNKPKGKDRFYGKTCAVLDGGTPELYLGSPYLPNLQIGNADCANKANRLDRWSRRRFLRL